MSNNDIIQQLAAKFSVQLFDSGLDEDFDVAAIISNIVSDYESSNKKPKKTKKPKKKRKKTPYNVFVKEMMPTVKDHPSKERFAALGKIWRSYGEDDKKEWQKKADEINAALTIPSPVQEAPVQVSPVQEEIKSGSPLDKAVSASKDSEAPLPSESPLVEESPPPPPKKKRGRKKKKKDDEQ